MTFTVQDLQQKAPLRKPGYVEEVMATAKRTGNLLELDRAEFERIRKTFAITGPAKLVAQPSLPKSEWPIWAKALKHIATPEDKGIGDVVARIVGDEKGEAFKTWYKKMFGKSCGCNGRQADWNRRFPLP